MTHHCTVFAQSSAHAMLCTSYSHVSEPHVFSMIGRHASNGVELDWSGTARRTFVRHMGRVCVLTHECCEKKPAKGSVCKVSPALHPQL